MSWGEAIVLCVPSLALSAGLACIGCGPLGLLGLGLELEAVWLGTCGRLRARSNMLWESRRVLAAACVVGGLRAAKFQGRPPEQGLSVLSITEPQMTSPA